MNYYNEFDPKAAAWLRQLIAEGHIPKGTVDERSITDVQPADLAGFTQCHFFAGIGGWSLAPRLAGWPKDRRTWTGSCPCQGLSTAGRKLGEADPRHLWPTWFSLIKECLPSDVLGEQVASGGGRRWMLKARNQMEQVGYGVGVVGIGADSIGADHHRPRLWFVAHSGRSRQPESGGRFNAFDSAKDAFREADRLVDAVQRNALPFLCGGHDGLPKDVAECALKGFGNAIVPQVAAQFIQSACEALNLWNSNS